MQVGLQKEGRSQSLNHLGNGEAAAQAPAVKRVSSESMISLIDFGADPEPVVATAIVPDPFASAPANKVASDPFAAPVASANQSVVDLFAPGPGATPFADPFAAAAPAPAVTDPFASAAPAPTVADPFASAPGRLLQILLDLESKQLVGLLEIQVGQLLISMQIQPHQKVIQVLLVQMPLVMD